ncbi:MULTISPECIES: ABC transporter substrate-binding protein [Aminobacterium]|jgi:branched-chain amino acid transport system substrate-binding protein|uniref:ABC transporter substrate-binding protein n=1 Tax=Aminobacterium TaxID=81466 RepID=UPI0004AD2499|nr:MULTISPECIES: ABC transporter substrate-binding protein [Aminobacterium]
MKRSVRLIAALLLVFCLSGSALAADTIRIALVAPFTGLGSILGDFIKKGAQLAVDEINAKGGIDGKQIEMLVYDDQANPSTAMNVVRKVINDDVVAIFGPNMSSAVLGVHSLAKQSKIPMLVAATSPNLDYSKTKNDYLFRLRANDDARVSAIVKYVVEKLDVKKPGIIYGTTDYCTAALAVAEREFKKYGIEVVAKEQMKEGDKDATGQLLKLKNSGFDCLVGFTHEPEAAICITQARQLQLDVPLIGFSAWSAPVVKDLAGDAMVGVYAAMGFDENDPSQAVQNFVKNYSAKWDNESPTDPGQAYYDGIYLFAKVVEAAKSTDGPALIKALNEVQIDGVQGMMKCDENHNFTNYTFIARYNGSIWEKQ